MNDRHTARAPRAELIERCRQQRARLAGLTGAATAHLHTRDLTRAIALVRRVLRVLEQK